ncbi:MAG: hypothetical protein ACRDQA_12945 [Nocardioidaceae bacterium]
MTLRNGHDGPSSTYLDQLFVATQQRMAEATPLLSSFAGADADLIATLTPAIEQRTATLVGLSQDVHAYLEVAYGEHHATAAVAAALRQDGHAVQVVAFGLKTVLRARRQRTNHGSLA